MRVIVDAFGGDNAPLEIMKGAALAVSEYGYTVVLTGDEQKIRQVAADESISLEGIEIVDAPDVISMNDSPKSILREHKDCSLAMAFRLLADGRGDAVVSAGSTGALLMGGTFIVKRIKGISRPALAAIVPSSQGPFMLVDSGANADCRADMLLQFAQMGSLYMSEVMNNGVPVTVGLLNVGTEEHKGGELQHETFPLLKDSGLNFIGNVEARDVPHGAAQVVVADGFSGNVLLKTMEGTSTMILDKLKDVFYTNMKTKTGALLVKKNLYDMKKDFSTAEYGGAPLLGVTRPVIKAHGNADAFTIKNAIRVSGEFAKVGIIEKMAALAEQTKE